MSFLRRTVLALVCILAVPAVATASAPNPRQHMHGIGTMPGITANTFNVFFSSSGLSSRGVDRSGSWPHDVYVTRWHVDTGVLDAPCIFIQKPGTQEPVTVAHNRAGQAMASFGDSWNAPENVSQRFGIYDTALRPIKPYPQQVESGGHSGHIMAVGDRFVVFYSDGRVTGGGVDNLDSGNDVYLKVYDGYGRRLYNVDVTDGRREWWPMVAGGSTNALLAWQQFVPGQTEANLKIAVFDLVSGRATGEQLLHKHLQYYTYNATWISAIERYLLVGVAKGNDFADLINTTGKVRASISCMSATVHEAGITANQNVTYTPAADGHPLQLQAGPDALTLLATLLNTDGKRVQWRLVGSTDLLRMSGVIDWMSLTEKGLKQLYFGPAKTQPVNAIDQCR